MPAPLVVTAIASFLGKRTLRDLAVAIGGGLIGAGAGKVFDSSSEEICGCLAGIDEVLREIDATLKDGFSGRSVDLEAVQRRLNRTKTEKLFTEAAIPVAEEKLEEEKRKARGFSGGGGGVIEAKELLEALETEKQFLDVAIATLEEEKARLEAAVSSEQGLLAAFLELDAALQSANLPAGLEALAGAVEVAAARIANAVGSAPEKKAPGGSPPKFASGGTVQPGLVGERGPEVILPFGTVAIPIQFERKIGRSGDCGRRLAA